MSRQKQSYSQILKSSLIIGGSSGVTIVLGIIRTKVIALLLGSSGVGLVGLYSSIAETAKALAGLGINFSGVRQIAAAVGTGDDLKIAQTVRILRLMSILCGVLGALVLILFSRSISRITFGDENHAPSIVLLSLVVLFGLISAGQMAVVQGMRQIANLAKVSIIGGVLGTAFSVAAVYFLGDRGIVFYLIFVAATAIVASWWYARKIKVASVSMTWNATSAEAAALVRLGAVFMSSGFMSVGVAYLVRVILSRKMGVDAVGCYQAAWTIAGLYVGFVLQAMGADFYPRLTGNATDHGECNRLINEQIEVGLLLVGPGVLATLTFATIVIQVFYSGKFGPAIELLRWFCVGMYLRIVSWPLGFLLLAKGKGTIYFCTELVSNTAHLALAWFFISQFGLRGSAMAFSGLYLFYWPMMSFIARQMSGYRLSGVNARIMSLTGIGILVLLGCSYHFQGAGGLILGVVMTTVASVLSVKRLCVFVHQDKIPLAARKLLTMFRLIEVPQHE